MAINGDLLKHKQAEMGQFGIDYIADTDTHTGKWWKIIVIDAAVCTTNTLERGAAQAFGGATLDAGMVLVGDFTAIDLASGGVVAVRSDPIQ